MLAPPAGIPRHCRGTPLKRIKEVQWTYVAGAVIVDTVVYLWSRAAHPLPSLEGYAARRGVCIREVRTMNLLHQIKTDSSKIDFTKISGFREAGKYIPPACGGNPEILEKLELIIGLF